MKRASHEMTIAIKFDKIDELCYTINIQYTTRQNILK